MRVGVATLLVLAAALALLPASVLSFSCEVERSMKDEGIVREKYAPFLPPPCPSAERESNEVSDRVRGFRKTAPHTLLLLRFPIFFCLLLLISLPFFPPSFPPPPFFPSPSPSPPSAAFAALISPAFFFE